MPHLCGATLLATQKKGGGHRPIAVGEVLRRLVSKCLAQSVHHEAASILAPLQVGVGIPAGSEAVVHAVRDIFDDHGITPSHKWTLLLDFSNAFNSVDRGEMLKEVRSRIPSLSPWLEFCYSSPSLLHFGSHTINSCCGVQQGDPLGPLGFALAVHPILEKIRSEVPGLLLNSWYLDDGTLCGSPDDLKLALSIVEELGPARGLSLNRDKSLLFVPGEGSLPHNPLPPESQFLVRALSCWVLL